MLQRWINTSPALPFLLTRLPMSWAGERDWAARASSDPKTPTFIIQTRAGKDIGVTGLIIDGSRATFGIAIHERRYWNAGYGTDATRVIVDGGFRALPLQRIELTVYPENVRAIRCYKKVGFVREGVLRAYHYRNGKHHDVVIMSILHDDWRKRRDRR